MILVPFLPVHLQDFELQRSQAWLQPHLLTDDYIHTLTVYGESFSLVCDGFVLGCGGLIHLTPTRSQVWALVRSGVRGFIPEATILVKCFLDKLDTVRVETTVKTDFKAGHRWAKRLGFEYEGTMRKWENMQDFDIYARVK